MAISLLGVDNPGTMIFKVKDQVGTDRFLVMATGVARCEFKGLGNDFIRDTLVVPTGIASSSGYIGALASAWPASVANDGVSNNAGWAVDSVYVPPPATHLHCHLAVRDTDGWILRVGFRIDAVYSKDPWN